MSMSHVDSFYDKNILFVNCILHSLESQRGGYFCPATPTIMPAASLTRRSVSPGCFHTDHADVIVYPAPVAELEQLFDNSADHGFCRYILHARENITEQGAFEYLAACVYRISEPVGEK